MKKKYSKTMVSLQAFVGRWLLNFIYNTNEWNVRGERNFKSSLENNKSVIVSGWHGTLLAPFMNLAKKNLSYHNFYLI